MDIILKMNIIFIAQFFLSSLSLSLSLVSSRSPPPASTRPPSNFVPLRVSAADTTTLYAGTKPEDFRAPSLSGLPEMPRPSDAARPATTSAAASSSSVGRPSTLGPGAPAGSSGIGSANKGAFGAVGGNGSSGGGGGGGGAAPAVAGGGAAAAASGSSGKKATGWSKPKVSSEDTKASMLLKKGEAYFKAQQILPRDKTRSVNFVMKRDHFVVSQSKFLSKTVLYKHTFDPDMYCNASKILPDALELILPSRPDQNLIFATPQRDLFVATFNKFAEATGATIIPDE